jgi:LPS export ABC transporter protein LptC
MDHVARGLLVVVALFVLTVAGTLFAKSRAIRMESAGPPPTSANLHIKDVEIEEETKGVRWRLKAEQALSFEPEGRTALRKLAVSVQEPERSWTIVGDDGDVFQKEKRVEVRNNVRVTSSDGLSLETTVLRWEGEGKRLWTDAPVTISRGNSRVRGAGLEVRMEDEVTTVGGPVRATFTKSATP